MNLPPGTVTGAKVVQLAMVTYVDDSGLEVVQLAVLGDNNVHLLDSKISGLSRTTSPVGLAKTWLMDGIFKILKKGKKRGSK